MFTENCLIGEILVKKRIRTKKEVVEAWRKQRDLKKQKKTVSRLCELLNLPDKETTQALGFQKICRAMKPHLPYPGTNTVFGKSLTECVQDKCAVALYVATRGHAIIERNDKLFISDGSHGYFLFLATVFRKHEIEIVTNNLGVAGEYVLRPGKITRLRFPSNGTVSANYGGLFDLDNGCLESEMEHANIFISVEVLDPGEGPCLDSVRAVVRRAALKPDSKVTILADYHTLSHDPKFHAKIFQIGRIQTWRDWLESNSACIITTPHPDMPDSELELPPDRRSHDPIPEAEKDNPDSWHTWQRYSQNSKKFYEMIGDRFIEVDREGCRLNY